MRIRLPVLILVVLAAVYFVGDLLPNSVVVGFYTLSHLIKGCLVFVLPWIIFVFMSSFLSEMEQKAWSFVAILAGSILISNVLVTYVSYGVFKFLHPLVITPCETMGTAPSLAVISPLYTFPIAPIFSNNIALLSGLSVGIVLSFFSRSHPFLSALVKMRAACVTALRKVLIPIIPLFILGFLLKLQRESNLDELLAIYIKVFIITLLTMMSYVLFMCLVAGRGQIQEGYRILKMFFPASMVAFASMSSMAAYPVTLNAVERFSTSPKLMQGILTSTVNTHLMGVGVAIPILSITVLMYFGQPFPDLLLFSVFAFYLTLAKFSVAAIPGGSIMMAVPVLQDYLGFTPEMSALIVSIYMLIDPFSTATNVLGNGAFATFLSRFFLTTPTSK